MTIAQGTTGFVPRFEIGHRLSLARETAEISQERMGQLLGCSRRTIVRYEAATAVPRSVILAYHVSTRADLAWLETGTSGSPDGDGLPHLDSNQEPTG